MQNTPLKSINRQYRLLFLCLLSSKTAVSLRFASRHSRIYPHLKGKGRMRIRPMNRPRIVSYATNIIYLFKIFKKPVIKLSAVNSELAYSGLRVSECKTRTLIYRPDRLGLV